MRSVRATSPAKLNLGLEITARRPNGFHDIASIFQSITLADHLTFTAPASQTTLHVQRHGEDDPSLVPDNLISTAVDLLATSSDSGMPTRIELDKHIPLASGLGGASSNAATTLRALTALWNVVMPEDGLSALGGQLGGDVPFFLTGGTAFVSGTGDRIVPLQALHGGWFVLLYPRLRQPIHRKTATLYQALTNRDFTSGEAIQAQVGNIQNGKPLDPALLTNPFQHHVLTLRPEIRPILDAFTTAGAPFVAMSGAGPAHYTYVTERHQAERIADRARSSLGSRAELYVVSSCPELPELEK